LSFENQYGSYGKGYIHVHHLVPLSKIGKDYVVNPIQDLRPVCPNCHAMLHKNTQVLQIEELKSIINKAIKKPSFDVYQATDKEKRTTTM